MANATLSHSKFIHIPKCGGTALQTALWYIECIKDKSQSFSTPQYGHLFASQMPNDGKPCFTFVRNPVTWWQSFYYWNMNLQHSRFSEPELKTTSFNQWLNDYGEFWLGLYSRLVYRYTGSDNKFNVPACNVILPEHVGKTENLYNDLKLTLLLLGQPFNKDKMDALIAGKVTFLPEHANVQNYNRSAISPASIDLIRATEKHVIERYGY